MSRPQSLLLLLLGVLLVAALRMREHGQDSASGTDGTAASATPAAGSAQRLDEHDTSRIAATPPPAIAQHQSTSKRSSFTPVPPAANAAQVHHIRYWSLRAQSGDAYARCRYAREAQQCAVQIHNMAPWMRERFLAQRVTRGDFGEIADCRGVTEQDIAAQFDALLLAAEHGHVPSQLLFAAGGGFASLEGFRHPDRLLRYREHAGAMAWRAFEAGNSDAAVLLWRAYNGVDLEAVYIAGAIEPDPVRAHALDLLLGDLVPDHLAGTASEAGLTHVDAKRARDLVTQWRSRAFARPRPPNFGTRFETMFDWEKHSVDLCAENEAG